MKDKIALYFWISKKFLLNKKNGLASSGYFSLLGLVLGVAMLVVSQSVMRGFESTLQAAVIDTTGDIQIVKRGTLLASWEDFVEDLKKVDDRILVATRFVNSEAVLSMKGRVSGVLVQGIDVSEYSQVLNIGKRVKEGTLPFEDSEIAVGQGLAKELDIKVEDRIYLAVPLSTPFESSGIRRRATSFVVKAIVDFGKNDWNERLVISRIQDLQDLTQIGDRFTGAYLKISNSKEVQSVTQALADQYEPHYYINNWYNINRNLLEAVQLEKVVIFFVVFLIVVVAAFNISSSLYVLVRSRFKDISILKTIGFTAQNVKMIFLSQGVLIGTIGTFLGFILGYFLSTTFMWLQTQFHVISGAVYKVDRIDTQMSAVDLLVIYVATLIACIGASFFPARKAARMTIMEGFRDE